MPVYNTGQFVCDAIDSILRQTFEDFELLIIDDGSGDETRSILERQRDSRIRLIRHRVNRGIVVSLNEGFALSRGDYIARMDADDVSRPQRFVEQHAYMRAEPKVIACGTLIGIINGDGRGWVEWCDSEDIRIALLFESPICHPTAMFRTQAVRKAGVPFNGAFPHAEDYAMWVELTKVGRCANLRSVLLDYRIHPQQVSAANAHLQGISIQAIQRHQLAQLDIHPRRREWHVHNLLGDAFSPLPRLSTALAEWRERLIQANARRGLFDQERFRNQLQLREQRAVARISCRLRKMSLRQRCQWRLATLLR